MLSLRIEPIQIQTVINGGVTESIFPKVEKRLNGKSLEALQFVASKKNMDKYKSVIDFFFCEIFPDWQDECFAFYKNNGCNLKKMLTPEEVASYESWLLIALDIAEEFLKETQQTFKGRSAWHQYHRITIRQILFTGRGDRT